VYNRI
jgi:hypothetical protein